MKKASFFSLTIVSLLVMGAGCGSSQEATSLPSSSSSIVQDVHQEEIVSIKYREDSVDVGNPSFESLNTAESSFVFGAWYDKDNEYLVLNLNGTNYQYCDFPEDVWEDFKYADSFGSFYNSSIKGDFSCKGKTVPEYSGN